MLEQVQLALENGKEKPDVIYLTGGSARSPLIKKALAEQLPGIPIKWSVVAHYRYRY